MGVSINACIRAAYTRNALFKTWASLKKTAYLDTEHSGVTFFTLESVLPASSDPVHPGHFQAVRWVAVFYGVALLAGVLGMLLLYPMSPHAIGDLSNLMGPLAENLAHGRGFVVCSDGMTIPGNVLCYHAARMPLPPLLLASLDRLFAGSFLAVEGAKIALVLLPVAGAALLCLRALAARSLRVRAGCLLLLLGALLLPVQFIDALNMQVEEGYSFCFLTLAVAILFFTARGGFTWRLAVISGLDLVALYLTKSSMIAVALFLALALAWRTDDRRKAVTIVLLFLCGPLGWGLFTLHASGHFTVGTSLDGINLHKGNYREFLDRYPPAPDEGLDRYDASLNAGNRFSAEWTFHRFHMQAAETFILHNPGRTLAAAARKAWVFFVSPRKIGSRDYTGWLGELTVGSMLLFRLLLWASLVLAAWDAAHGSPAARLSAWLYLGIVVAAALPYLAGFALTRHAAVLSLPAALFLCSRLQPSVRLTARSGWPASPDAVPVQIR